jgi:hypothetical protein
MRRQHSVAGIKSLFSQRIFDPADGVLDLTCDLVGLAVGLPLMFFAAPAMRSLSMIPSPEIGSASV